MYGIRRNPEKLDRTVIDKTTEAKKENAPLLGNTVSKEKVEEARAFWGRYVWGETETKKESDAE